MYVVPQPKVEKSQTIKTADGGTATITSNGGMASKITFTKGHRETPEQRIERINRDRGRARRFDNERRPSRTAQKRNWKREF